MIKIVIHRDKVCKKIYNKVFTYIYMSPDFIKISEVATTVIFGNIG